MLVFLLLIFGMFSRFIVHVPNFTPVISIALLSGAYLNKRYAIVVPVALMILSDLVIGLHETILFTWGSMALIAFMGFCLRGKKNFVNIAGINLWSAILFFLATNFGTWLMSDLYPKNTQGLIDCFILAVPFFRTTLWSTLMYSALFFGAYEIIAARVKSSRWATVLLTAY